jgi:hypothetical protein
MFFGNKHYKIQPYWGSCYNGPKELISRGVLNVKNNDDFCFLYSLAAALFPAKSHKDRPSNYKKYVYNYFNIKNSRFLFYYGDTKKFEDQNPTFSINIFTIDEKIKICGPIYKSDYTLKRETDISLLIYTSSSWRLRRPSDRRISVFLSIMTLYCFAKKIYHLRM